MLEELPTRTLESASPSSIPWPALFAGRLDVDPRQVSGRRGRTRRWSYSGAGGPGLLVGAAIVDIGVAATAFAWAQVGRQLHTWEARGVPFRHVRMGATAASSARFRRGDAAVSIGEDGDVDLDVPTEAGRLHVRTRVTAGTPAVLCCTTPQGGWNATQKAAGEVAEVEVSIQGERHTVTGGSWRDWTMGAQDRQTSWRWAAGAGVAVDGTRVGLNLSTGMNADGPGEDLVWWGDVPHAIEVETLAPVGDDPTGDWRLEGPGWALAFRSQCVRAATERMLVVRSSYVQPIGSFEGSLPGADGRPVPVRLVGVTEDHEARW